LQERRGSKNRAKDIGSIGAHSSWELIVGIQWRPNHCKKGLFIDRARKAVSNPLQRSTENFSGLPGGHSNITYAQFHQSMDPSPCMFSYVFKVPLPLGVRTFKSSQPRLDNWYYCFSENFQSLQNLIHNRELYTYSNICINTNENAILHVWSSKNSFIYSACFASNYHCKSHERMTFFEEPTSSLYVFVCFLWVPLPL